MRARHFLQEAPRPKVSAQNKLQFITNKLSAGEVTDPKTIDYIYKIINKPEIQQTVMNQLGTISGSDEDVANFQKANNDVLAKIIRKLPVEKEKLDAFLKQWASGKGFVNTALLKPGARGNIKDLIPDQTAYIAFETFERLRSIYRMTKKGTTGYGEFGLAMLSPLVKLKAPGDIEVNGAPVEVKGNNARLYADERTPVGEALEAPMEPADTQVPVGAAKLPLGKKPMGQPVPVQQPAQKKVAPVATKRGGEVGALNNVVANLLSEDPTVAENTANEITKAFANLGVTNVENIIQGIMQKGPDAGLELLKLEWWKAGFSAYQRAIQMPILVLGPDPEKEGGADGQFLMSDKPDDFVSWGCLPRSITAYGYMFGRTAGQSRETYPKIFVPGYNK